MKSSGNNQPEILSPTCRLTQSCLSEYVDNTLSAHQVWEVEKHLTLCTECSEAARNMQATVQLLHDAVRFDTGDDFMAKLHARLDGLEPDAMLAPKRSLVTWAQDLFERVRIDLTSYRIPVLNFGVATAGMGAMVVLALVWRPASEVPQIGGGGNINNNIAVTRTMHEDLQRNLALTASDPLGDVAAENLRITDSNAGGNTNGAPPPTGTDGG